MREPKLPKANKNNNVQKYDRTEVVVKKSKEKNNIIPKVKKYLVQVGNTGKDLCISSTKELVKLSWNALKIIGNKLANIDWGMLILKLLKELFATTEEPKTNYYTETRIYEFYTTTVENSNQNIHRTEPTKDSRTGNTAEQKQIEYSKTQKIKVQKQKQIESSKKKSIENKKNNIKQIQKKDNKIILNKHNYLMIENKSKKKD